MKLSIFFILIFGSAFLDAQDTLDHEKKGIGVLPVPTFGYAPETKFYGGAVCLFTLRRWHDSTTRFSNAKLELSYTQNNQFIAEAGCNLFTPKEKYNIEMLAGWRKFPEFWWGMGNMAQDSAKSLYNANRYDLDLRVSRNLSHHFFLGLRYRIHKIYQVINTDGSLLENTLGPDVNGGYYHGVGPHLNIDNRSNLMNPRKGFLVQFSLLAFARELASDADFLRVETDLRKYIPMRKNKDVLALQAYSLFNIGDPPFRLGGLMGSEREMRGYYQGRYRDQHYYAGQAEYRLHVYRRFGSTFFIGGGDVFGNWSQSGLKYIKPSIGGGVRFLVDKKDNVNLRFDYAIGKNTSGFYVSFGEAF